MEGVSVAGPSSSSRSLTWHWGACVSANSAHVMAEAVVSWPAKKNVATSVARTWWGIISRKSIECTYAHKHPHQTISARPGGLYQCSCRPRDWVNPLQSLSLLPSRQKRRHVCFDPKVDARYGEGSASWQPPGAGLYPPWNYQEISFWVHCPGEEKGKLAKIFRIGSKAGNTASNKATKLNSDFALYLSNASYSSFGLPIGFRALNS